MFHSVTLPGIPSPRAVRNVVGTVTPQDVAMDDPPRPSIRRHRAYVATAIAAILVAIAAVLFAFAQGRFTPDTVIVTAGVVTFTIVGALILDRRPSHPIGRICLTVGLGLMLAGLMQLTALFLDQQPGRMPPIGAILAIVGSTLFTMLIVLSGPLLTSRFPDGASTGRIRRTQDVLLLLVVGVLVLQAFNPGDLEYGWIEPVPNPIGIDALRTDADLLFQAGVVGYVVASVLAVFGLAMRYRRGGPVLRAQIRWFAAAVGTTLTLIVATIFTSDIPGLNDVVYGAWIASLLLPPIAIAVAILRYHLYDIDRIISRTITYGLVSVVLFGLFGAINVAVQSSVNPFADAGPVVVAASTLLVAVLFNPVRRRVQGAVDRQFHRARYDAEQTVDSLATRLRGEVDLGDLRDEILDVVHRSVEPDGAAVWLRPRGGT